MGVGQPIWPYSEVRGLRSRLLEICTSGSAGGSGGVISQGYPTYISGMLRWVCFDSDTSASLYELFRTRLEAVGADSVAAAQLVDCHLAAQTILNHLELPSNG